MTNMDKDCVLVNSKVDCKPFLRWAGGKRWLIKHLDSYLPEGGFNNYHEPFLGGGSIFFHLQPKVAYLSDINAELVETYNCIKNDVESVIAELNQFTNSKEFYYEIRTKKFRSAAKRAARFIYLNQTSFNGIFRVNLKGEYNVPYGFRTKQFCEAENLRAISLSLKNTFIKSQNFSESIKDIKQGDLVFLDPPYTVTHNQNGFIKYNAKLFDLEKQNELSTFIDEIKKRNAYYILTNAAHAVIEGIFKKEGDLMDGLSRVSLIGGINAKRGEYKEFIFTNTNVPVTRVKK